MLNKRLNLPSFNSINTYFRIFCRKCQLQAAGQNFRRPNIPYRIKRSPTDILKAIATTVLRDPTGPAYKFHDDPYLYPISNTEKKIYALCKESGIKSARFIIDEKCGHCFNHQPDDPVIEKFLPKFKIDENSEVTEADLLNVINNFQVSEAINVYSLCQSKNTEISAETRQCLLELISFYNCENAVDPDFIEERRFPADTKPKRLVKTWKDGGLAEELFEELKTNGVKPYCAIIQGMCNFGQVDRAWELYQEALASGLTPNTETFNAIIRITSGLQEDYQLRWDHIVDTMRKMVALKVPPNLGTMNSILEILVIVRNWPKARGLSLQVLSEFKNLNIEPSLASYYHLLKIYYTIRNATNALLVSILHEIDNKHFEVKDLNDDNFFFTAMEICKRDLQSWETAEKLHDLLMQGDNYNFIGGNMKEMIYFRHYFTLAVNSLPLEEFMKIYDSMIPHFYSPDLEVMEEIIKNIGLRHDLTILPRIWSDCILLQNSRNERLMEMTLMVIKNYNLEEVDSSLASQLANVAWDIWERIQKQSDKLRFKVEWNGQMLGDCLSSLVRCKAIERASVILGQLSEDPGFVIGVIPLEPMRTVFKAAVETKFFNEAVLVLKYLKENDFPEAPTMAKDLGKEPDISQEVKNKLISMFGSDVLVA